MKMNPRNVLAIYILSAVLISCTKPAEEPQKRPSGDTKALEALYDSTDISDYRSWDLFPGSTGFMDGSQGNGPHGRYVTVYANDVAVGAVSNDDIDMPDGAIVMKDAFDAEKSLRATVLMAKSRSVWHYGVISVHGVDSVQFIRFGKAGTDAAASCNDCHIDAERDPVFMWK